MTDIKFRVWNTRRKEFAYFDTPQFDFRKSDDGGVETFVSFANSTLPTKGGFPLGDWGEVEQFTGLKDKEGVEIYEGDLLDDPDGDGISYRIEHNEKNASFDIVSYGLKGAVLPHGFDEDAGGYGELDRYSMEDENHHYVIGNIHQNPELLEVGP